MTATDPRPELAAKLAAGLAPAAEALALAYAEDMSAGPPPPDDRALAERHRAGRAQLAHLRQLLAVLDWAGAHLPEPEPAPVEEPEEEPWEPPPAVKPDYDGSEDEFHYGGEAYVGSQETPRVQGVAGRHGAPLRAGPDRRRPPGQPERMQCQRADIHRQAHDPRVQGMARKAAGAARKPLSPAVSNAPQAPARTGGKPSRNPAA